jgi:hypothetical protein
MLEGLSYDTLDLKQYIRLLESGERSIDVIEFVNYCQAIGIDSAKFIKRISNKF